MQRRICTQHRKRQKNAYLSHVIAARAQKSLQEELAARTKFTAAQVWLDQPKYLLHDSRIFHGTLNKQPGQGAMEKMR